MRLLLKANSLVDRLINYAAILAVVLIIFIMLLVSAEVTMRYFLNKPIPWQTEVTEYCQLYATFLVAAWVLKREAHVRVDVLVTRFGARTQAILEVVNSVIGVIICALVVWFSSQVTWEHYTQSIVVARSLINAPYAPVLAVVPVGGFLFMLQFIRRTHKRVLDLGRLVGKEQKT